MCWLERCARLFSPDASAFCAASQRASVQRGEQLEECSSGQRRGGPIVLRVGQSCENNAHFYVYVGNLGVLDLDSRFVRDTMEQLQEKFNEVGLQLHASEVSSGPVEALGCLLEREGGLFHYNSVSHIWDTVRNELTAFKGCCFYWFRTGGESGIAWLPAQTLRSEAMGAARRGGQRRLLQRLGDCRSAQGSSARLVTAHERAR